MKQKKTDPDFIESLNFERVKTLYRAAASHGLLSSFLAISFIPLFMWPRVDHSILIIWVLSISTVNILRVILTKRFKFCLERNEITKDNAHRWEAYFVAGIALTALVWTVVIFFPFKKDPLASMLYVLLIHVGINAAIVSMYMASKNTMMAYLTITLIPGFSRVAWEGQASHIVIGCLGFLFIGIMISSIRSHSRNLIEIIELKILNEELSKKDVLTGLWNRRQLYDFIDKLIPASDRHNFPFCILMMDIDFFKNYNDTKGHNAGDSLLANISQIISTNIRSEDLAVRYGGEEFMVIFVGMEIFATKHVAERIRIIIEEDTDVTISSGLVQYESGVSFSDLTQRADNLLYKAKNSGRNMTIVEKTAISKHSTPLQLNIIWVGVFPTSRSLCGFLELIRQRQFKKNIAFF
ncbi:MAG: GGDEF domain-containing protein [Deltaproteobacteria bacterium]|nr:GGDEF domain-containing protein [Candidatus Tharpella sp.]